MLTDLEGNSSFTYPLSYQQCRFQALLEPRVLMKSSAVIQSFAFRLDGGTSSSVGTKKVLKPAVTFYLVPVTASAMSTTWKSNIGSAGGTLVFKGTLNLPAASRSLPTPNPFTAKIPVAKPFVWLAGKGNLLMDWIEGGSYSYLRWSEDGVSYPKSQGSLVTKVWEDKNCGNKRADKASLLLSRTGNLIGGTIDVRYSMYPGTTSPLDIMVVWLGGSNRSLGPIKLPIDLTGLGMPNCMLATDILVAKAATSSPLQWAVPNQAGLAGQTLFLQGMAIDSKKSAMVVTYNAWQVTILPSTPTAQGWQSVFRSRYTGQTTGYMSPTFYYAPVIRFSGAIR